MEKLFTRIVLASVTLFLGFSATTLRADENTLAATQAEALQKAHEYLTVDSEIKAFKTDFPTTSFYHPSFVDHPGYQSYRYHEVYVDRVIHPGQQWEVLGAGVDVHFSQANNAWGFSKRLQRWENKLSLVNLMDESLVGQKVADQLNLKFNLKINTPLVLKKDYDLHRKLLVRNANALPILWIDVKARALAQYGLRGGRVIVLNARDGSVVYNFSKIVYANGPNALIPPIQVRDGSINFAFNKQASTTDNSDQFKARYQKYCQVISQNKNTLGDPLLINPPMCTLTISFDPVGGDKKVGTADDSAIRAMSNQKKILNYYLQKHNQYGADNNPTNKTVISSVVHIGKKFDNAYWDSDLGIMAYGDGSGGSSRDATHDYTLALDIAGHEFTHAIVSNTADFVTPGEPGALNEAFADIFGILISRSVNPTDDWEIGKSIYNQPDVIDSDPADDLALRSISHPSKFVAMTTADKKDIHFPEKYSERLAANEECNDDNDQCQVHANSTIWSYNAFLINDGFQKRLNLAAKEADDRVGKLFFMTLTHRLHQNSTMKESAAELLQTCVDLYHSAESKECQIVQGALKKTELL